MTRCQQELARSRSHAVRRAFFFGCLRPDRFARDRPSLEVETRIDRDLASGERSGVQGTPTFFVNGIRNDGGYDLESLRSAILAHIDGRAQARSRHA